MIHGRSLRRSRDFSAFGEFIRSALGQVSADPLWKLFFVRGANRDGLPSVIGIVSFLQPKSQFHKLGVWIIEHREPRPTIDPPK